MIINKEVLENVNGGNICLWIYPLEYTDAISGSERKIENISPLRRSIK